MPKTKTPKKATSTDATSAPTTRERADQLYRAAFECVRQRERYSRLVDTGTSEEEQAAALRLATMCDEILLESVSAYEASATTKLTAADEWWHKANTLWQAAREYERRHRDSDQRSQKLFSHSAEMLVDLNIHYDLEGSALLGLRHAVGAYRKVCPDCDLTDRPQSHVA